MYFEFCTSHAFKINIVLLNRPELHHYVVIFYWSSGIMDFVLFTFVNAHALRDVSGVASFITIISTFGKLNSDYVLCVNQTIPIKMKS